MIYGRYSVYLMDNEQRKYVVFDNDTKSVVWEYRFTESSVFSRFNAIADAEKLAELLNRRNDMKRSDGRS